MAWHTSTRKGRLPTDWQDLRKACKARAKGRCEADHHDPSCNGVGTECDHIIQGDDHSLTNLQWLSAACHKAKTARETAQRNAARGQARKRPQERHPGAL